MSQRLSGEHSASGADAKREGESGPGRGAGEVFTSLGNPMGVEGEAARLVLSLLWLSLPRRRCRIIWFCVIVFFIKCVVKCASVGTEKKEKKEKRGTRGKRN